MKGDIYASTFDEPTENHPRGGDGARDRQAAGRDRTRRRDPARLDHRLARAYNLALPASGKTLSGGVDPVALYPPKRFFGAARSVEGGGSLTIIATCLVDTGSRMDDVIYEEFKGTGNMELALDRKLSEKRIFPAIDVLRSGTRREAAARREHAAHGLDHASHAERGRPPGDRAAHAAPRQDEGQRGVPRLGKSVEASER